MKSNINQKKGINLLSLDDARTYAKMSKSLKSVVDTTTGEVIDLLPISFYDNTKERFKPFKNTDYNLEFLDTRKYLLHLVFSEKKLKQIDISVLLYISTQVDTNNEMIYTLKSIYEGLHTTKHTIIDSIKRLQAYKFIDIINDKHTKKIRLLTLNCHFSYKGNKYDAQSNMANSPHIIGFKEWAKENNCNLNSIVNKYGVIEQININVNIENLTIQQNENTEKKQ